MEALIYPYETVDWVTGENLTVENEQGTYRFEHGLLELIYEPRSYRYFIVGLDLESGNRARKFPVLVQNAHAKWKECTGRSYS